MSVLSYLLDALKAPLPEGAFSLSWEAMLGRGLALLLFALLLHVLRYLLRWASDLALNRFGAWVRRAFWNLLFWTALFSGASAIFGIGRPEAVLLVGVKLTAAYLVWRFAEAGIEVYLERRGVDPNLVVLTRYLALALILVWTAYLVAGREIAPLIGALGVAGLAVSLAAQDTFSSFIAGVVLLADWVRVGEKLGRVEGIILRTTRIGTPDNERFAIPNAKGAGGEIQNLSAGGPLRIHVPVGVAYRYDPREVRPVPERALRAHPALLSEPAPEPTPA